MPELISLNNIGNSMDPLEIAFNESLSTIKSSWKAGTYNLQASRMIKISTSFEPFTLMNLEEHGKCDFLDFEELHLYWSALAYL